VSWLRRELRDIVSEDLRKALLNLGYTERVWVNDEFFATVRQVRGEWRRGRYHVKVESRRRKLVLHLYLDLPSAVGHISVQSGQDLEKEFQNIMRTYRRVRSTSKRLTA